MNDVNNESNPQMEDQKSFRTLRGFLNGDEPNEDTYFAYSATLRIFGVIPDLDAISKMLGLTPTQALHKGDRVRPRSAPLKHDCWHYQPPVPETEHLEVHINALWSIIKPHRDYIKGLKSQASVDVFLGYRSNCDHAGIEVSHTCLEMFTELEIPFGVSIIIA
jgi:hypothetical protein